ncbi:Amidase family protein [Arabidopsis thaliana]|uniref:Amidase family protein n=1 Tax=Arabidopsis thaliana TaxID=3702 RepID=F4K6N2_ARATH|nr:Amidase family protein [Arabidopsis thaliana]AED91143.1 Amidase family protein [Arabidopsis thaliana]|eukprot:NP_001078540.1 Amidase family protein [Arabidopsis thaliana]
MARPSIATCDPSARPCLATRGSLPRSRTCAPLLFLCLLLGLTVFCADANPSDSKLLCSRLLPCEPSIEMVRNCKNLWKLLDRKVSVPCRKITTLTRTVTLTELPDKTMEAKCLQGMFELIDSAFFNETKLQEIAKGATEMNVPIYRANRKLVATKNGGLENPSPLVFNPSWNREVQRVQDKRFKYPSASGVKLPRDEEDIAFMSVLELGELIKTRQITSKELVRIYLKQLKRYNHVLEAVVTYTEELAYKQAKEADDLLSQGTYLGPLHGIPYGLKDIVAVPGYKTTWGSTSFKDQFLDIEAWVYKRLKASGAVLVAKLVTGSMAYDDIWFGGRTRNPWNIEEFSTGSSAGPAASTSAGSETAGSMTYPAARCGITALRPTFGSVGRTGVMSISESLDKLGPFCRTAADCAVILDAIKGKDPDDLSSREIAFEDPFSVDITKLTVGYTKDADMKVVEVLGSKGVNMVPFELNYTVESVQGILNFTMDVDMLAHFDEWQRTGQEDLYEAQDQWPVELRRARVVTAVDYIQAQRARGKLIREVEKSFTVDAFIGNVTDWEKVCMGNLVGLPVLVIPTGFKNITDPPTNSCRRRTTINAGIYAPPERDHIALALGMAYQSVTDAHRKRPPIDDLGPDDSIPNPPRALIPPRRLHI